MASSDNKDGAGPEDNKNPTDWAEIYTCLMCHANISYSEIHEMTIPAIEAITGKLGKHIAIKLGVPGLFGGALEKSSSQQGDGKPPKLSQFMEFANAFNG